MKIINYANQWWSVSDDGHTMIVLDPGKEYELEDAKSDKRTTRQNSSSYLWFSQIAEKLNNENIHTEQVIKSDISWDATKIKALFFDPVVFALYAKTSSTQLNKDEYQLIIDTLTKGFGQKGFQLPPYPSVDGAIMERNLKEMT